MYAPNFTLQLRWAGRRWLVCLGSCVLGFAQSYRGAQRLSIHLQHHFIHLIAKGA